MHMIILGIDVGLATTGWSILDKNPPLINNVAKLVAYGAIITKSTTDMPKRLQLIHSELQAIINTFKPDVMAIESIFYFKNQKTIIGVSQARGVMLLTAAENDIPVYDYTPLQVKTAVSGYGRADKLQIQKMVTMIYKLKEVPKPDDIADAIAVGTCHANGHRN